MTALTARRAAAVVATVLVAAVIAFVTLNRGAASGPSDDAAGGASDKPAAMPSAEARPLVERMLERLGAGRSIRSIDDPVQASDVPEISVASSVPVGRLTIPAMDLRTSYFEGVHDAVIDRGPGHWPGTPLPGQEGNSVFSGHRATHGAEFVDLDVLDPGDRIVMRVGGRDEPYTYRVRGTTIVDQSRYVPYVTRQPVAQDARILTLFACNPVWDSTHRIVVRAELVGNGPAEAG